MGTWRGDPDDAAARFLAEHGGVSSFDAGSGEHVAEFGNGALLPPWPPVEYDVGPFALPPSNRTEHRGEWRSAGPPSSSRERARTTPDLGDEQVPCPTCWLPADLIGPTDIDVLHHSLCPRGHDNTLAPVVLAHLRTL